MRNTNFLKIIFDSIMLVLLVMVYSATATGLIFHEIVGLLIFALFAIHLFYNRNWVIQVGKRIFDKTFGKKQKFMYVLNLLLLVLFLTAGISGILISKVLFKFEGKIGNMFILIYVHKCSAILSVVLIGIHLGIHWKMIINTVKNRIKIPAGIGKALFLTVGLAVLGIGVYGIVKSTVNSEKGQYGHGDENASAVSVFVEVFNIKQLRQTWARHELMKKMIAERAASDNNTGDMGRQYGGGEGQGRGGFDGDGHGQHEAPKFKLNSVIIWGMEYLSLLLLISLITYRIEKTIGMKKKNPLLRN